MIKFRSVSPLRKADYDVTNNGTHLNLKINGKQLDNSRLKISLEEKRERHIYKIDQEYLIRSEQGTRV